MERRTAKGIESVEMRDIRKGDVFRCVEGGPGPWLVAKENAHKRWRTNRTTGKKMEVWGCDVDVALTKRERARLAELPEIPF